MTAIKRILALVVVLLGVLLARAVRSEPGPIKNPVVHLEAGDTAPYSGDLVQSVTLMALVADHKQLRTYKRKLVATIALREQDRVEFQLTLDKVNASRVVCEQVQAPPPVKVPFFERPAVMFISGALVSGILTYALVRVLQ